MNEIMNEKVVTIMPGYSMDDSSIKRYPLQNTLISTRPGCGKSTMFNYIMTYMNLMTKPGEVLIDLFVESPFSIWSDETRRRMLPSLSTQNFHYKLNTVKDTKERVHRIAQWIAYQLGYDNVLGSKIVTDKPHVLFIDALDTWFTEDKEVREDIIFILKFGPDCYVYTVATCEALSTAQYVSKYFSLALCGSQTQLASDEVLGCDIAKRESGWSYYWVRDDANPNKIERIYCPGLSTNYINKVCKMLSSKQDFSDNYALFTDIPIFSSTELDLLISKVKTSTKEDRGF